MLSGWRRKEASITYHEHEEDCVLVYLLNIDYWFWSWNEEMCKNKICDDICDEEHIVTLEDLFVSFGDYRLVELCNSINERLVLTS